MDAVEAETVDEFLHGKYFFFRSGVPSQESNKVDHGFFEVAFLNIVFGGHVALAFAEFAAVGVEEQREVSKLGCVPPEGFVEPQVFWSGRQPFFAANHVGDFHFVVVHYVGEVVSGEAVGLNQHLVVHILAVETHFAADEVREEDFSFGNALANDKRGALRLKFLDLFLRKSEAKSVVLGRHFFGFLLVTHPFESFRSTEAGVSGAFEDELFRIFHVNFCALRLENRTFIPIQAEKFQRRFEAFHSAFHVTFLVRVFNAQGKNPLIFFGKKVRVQCGA